MMSAKRGISSDYDTDVMKAILDYESNEVPPKYEAARRLVEKIIAENGKV